MCHKDIKITIGGTKFSIYPSTPLRFLKIFLNCKTSFNLHIFNFTELIQSDCSLKSNAPFITLKFTSFSHFYCWAYKCEWKTTNITYLDSNSLTKLLIKWCLNMLYYNFIEKLSQEFVFHIPQQTMLQTLHHLHMFEFNATCLWKRIIIP